MVWVYLFNDLFVVVLVCCVGVVCVLFIVVVEYLCVFGVVGLSLFIVLDNVLV